METTIACIETVALHYFLALRQRQRLHCLKMIMTDDFLLKIVIVVGGVVLLLPSKLVSHLWEGFLWHVPPPVSGVGITCPL